MRRFSKALSVILAAVMLLTLLCIPVGADTQLSYTVFSGSQRINGWFPSFITQYMDPGKMSGFIEAIQNPGATIDITYTGNSNVGLLLQSYPIKDGGDYPWADIDNGIVTNSGDKKVVSFVASDLISKYTAKLHPDDNSNLRLDKVLNFSVGGEGNTIYSIEVKWSSSGKPGININTDMRYQTMDGWGASYTWYGDWLTNNNYKEQGFDWIFNDCEFNILRFRDLYKVKGYYGTYEDTSYPAYKAYYNAAVKRGIDPIVLVTSWGEYDRDLDFVAFVESDSEGRSYYTLAKDDSGNYMYDALAEHCVQAIQYFFDAGIPVDYFSISNETELQRLRVDENGNARQNAGFYLAPEEDQYHCAYWKAHIAIYNAFQRAFGDRAPKITGAEVMADTAWIMQQYLTPLIREAPYSFDTVTHHLYGSANTPSTFSDVYNLYGNYTLWQTEWYTNDLFKHAETLINELKYENINAYLYWNGVWIPDEGNCLIEIADWPAGASIKRRGNHYIMMHFSKFIKRGYTRIDARTSISHSNVTSFISPDGSEVVTVILNKSGAETLELNIDGFDIVSSQVYRTTINTTDHTKEETQNEYMKFVGSLNNGTLDVPANTLTTVITKIKSAEKAGECGDLSWKLDDFGTLTISGIGRMPDYTSEPAPWADESAGIRNVVIEFGAENIGASAFANCTTITSVYIPSSVKDIGASAFEGCVSLASAPVPYGTASIGNSAFNGCSSLSSVTFPASVTSIGSSAYAGCSELVAAEIPVNVVDIGNGAFTGCNNLTISAFENTFAQDYAAANGIKFSSLGSRNVVIGDIDGDGRVASALDSILLQRYVAEWDSARNVILDACDIDGDGEPATAQDAMALARHIAGWHGYENIPLSSD